MSVTVEQLQVALSVENPDFTEAERKVNAFVAKEFDAIRLKLDLDGAFAQLKTLRAEWEKIQRDIASGGALPSRVGAYANSPVGVPSHVSAGIATQGAGTAVATTPRASTVKPEKIAATTAATIEQIQKTSQAKLEAGAQVHQQKIDRIQNEGATRAARRVESIKVESEAKTAARIEEIQATSLKRQELRAQSAAEREMKAATRRAESKAKSARDQLGDKFSTGATLAGGAILAGIGLATNEGIKFEESFKGVKKTVEGTSEELDKIQRQLRDMAAGDNPIPIDVNDLNKIAANAGQLNIAKDKIVSFTSVIAKLGETTNLTIDSASQDLAQFGNITQMSQGDFDRLGATIVDLGNKGASTEVQIVEMSKRVAGAGHQIGLSQAEILGFSAALANVGIEAEAGGTAISKTFVDIDKAVRGGGKELNAYAQIAGMSAAQFKQSFKTDAAGAVTSFIEGLGKMQKAGGDVFGVLEALGISEMRQRDSLLRLAGSHDNLRNSLDISKKAWKDNTALNNEAKKSFESTSAQIKITEGLLRETALQVNGATIPAMRGLLKDIQGLARWFNSLDQSTKENIVRFGAYGGVLLIIAGRVKGIIEVYSLLKQAQLLARLAVEQDTAALGANAIAARASGAANVTAATTSATAWTRAAGLIRAAFVNPITIGIAVGGAGYELLRQTGVIDKNEHPGVMEAFNNYQWRMRSAYTPGSLGDTSGYDRTVQAGWAEDRAVAMLKAAREKSLAEKAAREKGDALYREHGSPSSEKAGNAPSSNKVISSLAGPPTKTAAERTAEAAARKAEREAEKKANQEKTAEIKLTRDLLDDYAKSEDNAASNTEKNARRMIEAYKGVQESLRGVLGELQTGLRDDGVKGNPLAGKIKALENLLNLNGRINGIAGHYGAVMLEHQANAGSARSLLDKMSGGDGNNPGAFGGSAASGSVSGRPAYIEAILKQTGKETAVQCGQAISNALKSSGINFTATAGARGGGQPAVRQNGRFPEGAIFAQDYGKKGQHFFVGYTGEDGLYRKAESTTAGTGPRRFRSDRLVTEQDIERTSRVFLPPGIAPVYAGKGSGKGKSSGNYSANYSQGPSSLNNPLLDLMGGGGLSGLNNLPAGWGNEVAPGETNKARSGFQQLLQSEKGPAFLQKIAEFISDPRNIGALMDFEKQSGTQFNITANNPTDAAAQFLRQYANGLDLVANKASEVAKNFQAAREFAKDWEKDAPAFGAMVKQYFATQKEHKERLSGLALPSLDLSMGTEFGKELSEKQRRDQVRALIQSQGGIPDVGGALSSGMASFSTMFGKSLTGFQNRQTRDAGETEFQTQSASRVAMLHAQMSAAGLYSAENPELQIQLSLLSKRNELEEQNRQIKNNDLKINVGARLQAYETELRAESELSRLMESQGNAARAVEATLMLQKEHELIMANTAAERVQIEQKYNNLLAERRGIVISEAEQSEQAKHAALAGVNESTSQMRAQTENLRDGLANGIQDGMNQGRRSMLQTWAQTLSEMMQRALAMRLANAVMGTPNEGGDIFDWIKNKGKAPQIGSVTGINGPVDLLAGAYSVHAKAAANRPGLLDADLPDMVKNPTLGKSSIAANRGGLLGAAADALGMGGSSMNASHITIHAVSAELHAPLATQSGSGSSAGSSPSGDQFLGSLLGSLG